MLASTLTTLKHFLYIVNIGFADSVKCPSFHAPFSFVSTYSTLHLIKLLMHPIYKRYFQYLKKKKSKTIKRATTGTIDLRKNKESDKSHRLDSSLLRRHAGILKVDIARSTRLFRCSKSFPAWPRGTVYCLGHLS